MLKSPVVYAFSFLYAPFMESCLNDITKYQRGRDERRIASLIYSLFLCALARISDLSLIHWKIFSSVHFLFFAVFTKYHCKVILSTTPDQAQCHE